VDRTGRQGENSINDIFTFILNQAGFQTARDLPPTFNWRSASPFGTAAHAEATNVLQELKDIGVQGAERIYSEVAVNKTTGIITQIGGRPITGHHNLDLVVVPEGQTLAVNQTLGAGQAEVVGDLKYGRGSITQAHSDFGQSAVTVNSQFNATPSATTPPGGLAPTSQAVITQAENTASTAGDVTKAEAAAARVESTVATAAKAESTVATVAKVESAASKVATTARVLKPLAPVAKVAGKVAGPLGLITGGIQIATATSRLDRAQAVADTAAGAATFAGEVGGAFSAGYAVGGLVDKGIEYASKKALGVDLSPSNGIATVLTAADRRASQAWADPSKPAYTQTLGWKLAGWLGI